MAHNINIIRPNDIVPHEVATIVHDHTVDIDFEDAQWVVDEAMRDVVTIVHAKPSLADAIEANGLQMFVCVTMVD